MANKKVRSEAVRRLTVTLRFEAQTIELLDKHIPKKRTKNNQSRWIEQLIVKALSK